VSLVAVVGAGAVGTRAVRQLIASPDVAVALIDPEPGRADRVAAALGSQVRVVPDVPGDAAVVVLAHQTPHAPAATRLVRAGAHVVTVCDDPDDTAELLLLERAAVEAGVSLVAGAGFSPGLSCLLARFVAPRFDAVEEIYVAKHGTGGPACARQHHRSLAGTASSWRLDDWVTQPAGTGRELCWFPEPIGGKDCYRAETSEPLLLHAAFPSATRIAARTSATRRDRLTSRLPMLSPPHPEGGLGALRVEVRGPRGAGRDVEVVGAVDRAAIGAGAVAAVAALEVLGGHAPVGAYGLADARLRTGHLLRELARRGVKAAQFVGTGGL
jgi:hypothetical protein